jgi:hypothetical protein
MHIWKILWKKKKGFSFLGRFLSLADCHAAIARMHRRCTAVGRHNARAKLLVTSTCCHRHWNLLPPRARLDAALFARARVGCLRYHHFGSHAAAVWPP